MPKLRKFTFCKGKYKDLDTYRIGWVGVLPIRTFDGYEFLFRHQSPFKDFLGNRLKSGTDYYVKKEN